MFGYSMKPCGFMLLFYIQQSDSLNKGCIFFESTLPRSKNPKYTSFTSLPTHEFTHSSCYWFRKSELWKWDGLVWQKHIRSFVKKKGRSRWQVTRHHGM